MYEEEDMPYIREFLLSRQLCRFLYIGTEKPVYKSGNWFDYNYNLTQNIFSIDEYATYYNEFKDIVSLIIQEHDRKLIQNPETLIFVLAMCAQQHEKENLRRKAYDAVCKVCKSPEHFILFNKFCSLINKHKDCPKKGGNGHGWRNAVKKWYYSKTPMELAKIATEFKSRYGWKHKDIIKLAHIRTTGSDREIVFKYMLFGFKKLKETLPDPNTQSETAEEIMKFFESVEDLKHCKDRIRSAALIDSLNLTLDHVPEHMLKFEEVWNLLVSSMSLSMILKNLQRIHNLGFLKSNGAMTLKVLDSLNPQNVTKEKIHPAVFLITVKNYLNAGKSLSYEKRKIKEQAKKPLPSPPKANKEIVDALYDMLNFSFSHLQATNHRYFIAIDTSRRMIENGCWRNGNVNAFEAGCLIAYSLIRTEKNVTIATFKNSVVESVIINADDHDDLTFLQFMKKLQSKTLENIDVAKLITEAFKKHNHYDVFINLIDKIDDLPEYSEDDIDMYKKKLKLPISNFIRFVNCALSDSSTFRRKFFGENIVYICGFDEKVPYIIEAFAR
ncbi:PREDICTED: 60 kDa SS-A/Ro ribonucleoprotein-like [Ceratosolen solmsi marchali]|uniref:60 kDa SS-A/Ro ribonucleoprotein-like n=1 Tax=Ceratosolen solmsi marchali TaxID=326594 RepID=A0AAJ6YXT5_9HYME|nr:PREDICTED: 60 kDa SS-A/Ro ribonucleoprotein-like [Ceratosolen solmsi marchali]